ncbi:hypothetical protein M231_07259 [Tremella mesenterica]|uniref:Hypoxia up-regulated 1 n=1 Tax=Tremella mesenterica TaxID=5217 RepID=A0A4Q1BFS0_TREME|nr:hypothetical protein M231_07259 [Tremella mesenterica]
MRIRRIWTALALSLPVVRAAVLAIDYGAEFTKLSLVKPGVPFDVVLDRDSKRKIQSVVGWKRDDRVFGQEGKMAATRFPDTHFPYIKPLLGSTSPRLDTIYPTPPTISPDGVLIFPHPSPPSHLGDETTWTPTALLAHQLAYFRTLAEDLASSGGGKSREPITQVIVTVPAWWTQPQRRAYRDALELQGLTCLAMIGEGTGVALNYAMTRSFPTFDLEDGTGQKEYHVVYDSGAMSTTATVVAFYQTEKLPTPKSKTPIVTTHIDVLGTGWEEIGGVMLDITLQKMLLNDFISKSGKKDARDDKKALAKISREANRVKHILSANQESNIAIESLYDDIDYKSRISRADLESAISESQSLFSTPIISALSSAGVTLDNISSVILFGGNTRVPFVQSAIRNALGGDEKVAQNVNADEAAVLGAAYYGAALSRQFKMKTLEVVERPVGEITSGGQVVFSKSSRLGERKSLLYTPQDDLTMEFEQAGSNLSLSKIADPHREAILSVHIHDVQKALTNFTAPQPVVNLTMRLDPRGHLSVANAVISSNITTKEPGMAEALKGLFGKKDKDSDATNVEELSDLLSTTTKGDKVALRFKETVLGVKPMTGEQKRSTMSQLSAVASFEAAKTAREEARNLLEGYLYRLSGLLDDDAENRALHEFATKEEREKMGKLMRESFEWLGEHAERADEMTLKLKRAALESLEAPIILRYKEHTARPRAIDDFQQAMFSARAFFVEAHKNNSLALESISTAPSDKPVPPPRYTEEELKVVEDMLKDNEKWIDGLMVKQVKIEGDKTKDPVILSKDLDDRGKRLQNTVLRLINKKPSKPPKAKNTTSTTSTTSVTPTSSDNSSSATFIPKDTPTSQVEPDKVEDALPAEPEETPVLLEGEGVKLEEEDLMEDAAEPEPQEVPRHEEL